MPRPPREFPSRCPSCQEVKAEDEFPHKIKAQGIRHAYCKPCFQSRQNDWRRRNADGINARRRERYTPEKGRRDNLKRYGITPEEYDGLLSAQGGGCAVCGEVKVWRGRRCLHVDHDHATGRVRGLLCHACNVSLGALADDPARIRRLALYVEGRLQAE